MSDEGINKFKAIFKQKAEQVAEIAGQKLGEAAFEAKKAYEAASPLAKSAIADLAQAAHAAKGSFDQAMAEAEARAVRKAEDGKPASSDPASPPRNPGP